MLSEFFQSKFEIKTMTEGGSLHGRVALNWNDSPYNALSAQTVKINVLLIKDLLPAIICSSTLNNILFNALSKLFYLHMIHVSLMWNLLVTDGRILGLGYGVQSVWQNIEVGPGIKLLQPVLRNLDIPRLNSNQLLSWITVNHKTDQKRWATNRSFIQ